VVVVQHILVTTLHTPQEPVVEAAVLATQLPSKQNQQFLLPLAVVGRILLTQALDHPALETTVATQLLAELYSLEVHLVSLVMAAVAHLVRLVQTQIQALAVPVDRIR
jgi:hypothetical protein